MLASCGQPPPETSLARPPGMAAEVTSPMLPSRTQSKTSVESGFDQWPAPRLSDRGGGDRGRGLGVAWLAAGRYIFFLTEV